MQEDKKIMTIPETKNHTEKTNALEKLEAAIHLALSEESVSDVLSVLTGAFVGLTVELVRRQGHDMSNEIRVDGGQQRDITIHAPKESALDLPSSEMQRV